MKQENTTFKKILGTRVLVERIPDTQQIGSLWVPDVAKRAHTIGYVVALGEDLKEQGESCPVNVGDRILFNRYAGVLFNQGERREYVELVMMDVLDVYAVFADDQTILTESEPNWKY